MSTKKKRHKPEAIVKTLREAEGDETILEVCRRHNITEVTFHRWKKKYLGMSLSDIKQMKALEKENAQLKKMLADKYVGDRCPKGCKRKKMVSPQHKKRAVRFLVAEKSHSVRRACNILSLNRFTYLYENKKLSVQQEALEKEIIALSKKHPRYGYRRITALLRRLGWNISFKKVHNIRKKIGLQVPRKKPKRTMPDKYKKQIKKADFPNHLWSWDFVSITTACGKPLRIMTLVDEYTRRWLAFHVARAPLPIKMYFEYF